MSYELIKVPEECFPGGGAPRAPPHVKCTKKSLCQIGLVIINIPVEKADRYLLNKIIYEEKKAVGRSFSLVRDYNDAKKVLLFTFR